MVYVLDLDKDDDLKLNKFVPLLSEERRRKMERYRLKKDRDLCLLSFLLLRYGLYVEYQKKELPELDCEKKPKIKEFEACFNISHCNYAVACAIDTEEVGVDIQDYNETVFDVRNMYLSKQEELMIDHDLRFNKELTRIWTLKEAYGKFYGYGLCYSLCDTSFDKIKDSDSWQSYTSLKFFSKKYDYYAISICSKKELDIRFIRLEEIIRFSNYLLDETIGN